MDQTDVPQTNGVVQLNTLHGFIDIHLFTNESPSNTKKFITLCLEGHYDYLPFGRYEKDFILQTTSEQTTTTSSFTTKLETSPLLKFNRRALVAMVSVDERGSSSDNFFITLAPAPELNRKSTIIGEVMGDSVHTLSKLEDSYDPVYSLIISTKVINHPWDDITSSIPDRDPITIKRISALKPKIDEYLGIESSSSSSLSYNANGNSKEKKAANDNAEKEGEVKLNAVYNKRKKSLLSFQASSSSSDEDEDNVNEVVVKNADPPKAVRKKVSAMEGNLDDIEIPYQSDDDEDEIPKQQNKQQNEPEEEISQMDLEILALQKAILAEPGKSGGTAVIPAAKERISSLSKLLGYRVKRSEELPQIDKNKKLPLDKDAILASFKEKLSNSFSSTDLHEDGNGDGDTDTNTDGCPTCQLHSLKDCQSCCLEKPVKPAAAEEKPWLTHRLLFKR